MPADLSVDDLTRFEQVYRAYSGQVYRYCLAQVGSRHDADDLTQEVFTSALADYGRSRPPADATLPWLLRIARNAAIDGYRRRATRKALLVRLFTRGNDADSEAVVEAEVLMREELDTILAGLRRLSARDRQLVGLRLAAGLAHADVAAVLGITEHAATVATGRAIDRLRKIVEGRR